MIFNQDINKITEYKYYRVSGMEMGGIYCNMNLVRLLFFCSLEQEDNPSETKSL
jgi:hypothetical protein